MFYFNRPRISLSQQPTQAQLRHVKRRFIIALRPSMGQHSMPREIHRGRAQYHGRGTGPQP